MPEPTTRDEHVARARLLAARADEVHEALFTAPWDFSDSAHDAGVAHLHAMVALGQLHLDLAGPEHEYAEAPKPVPLWVPVSKHRYERDGGVWALEYRSRLIDDDPDVGWYLYGPTCATGVRLSHGGLALAQQQANDHIAEMGIAGPRPTLDWRVKTSARDLFSCVSHGDLWWLGRVSPGDGDGPNPQQWCLTSGDGKTTTPLEHAPEDDENTAQLAAEAVLRRWYGDDKVQEEPPW